MHCRSFEHSEMAAASHKKRRRRREEASAAKIYDSACVAQHNCRNQNEGSDVKLGTGVGSPHLVLENWTSATVHVAQNSRQRQFV